jgi:transcriptional regulator with XRE-family HTH domain
VTGQELKVRREAADLSAELVAHAAGMSTARLRAIEAEGELDESTAAKVDRAIAIMRGLQKRLARRLIEAAHIRMQEVAGVQ